MPAPQALLCDLCGQKFFKRSLPIHRKQCEKKVAAAFTECKKCLRKVSNDEYEKHASECKVVRTKHAPKPKVAKERLIKPKRADEQDDGSDSGSSSDEEDYREQCGFCERKFNPDRIAKHEQICASNAERKLRKPFKSASQQRLEGTDFEKYIDPDVRRLVDRKPTRWRTEHERLKGIVEQGRLVKAFQEAGVPLTELPKPGTSLENLLHFDQSSPREAAPKKIADGMKECPHCSRTFNEEVASRHIPKCKTTANKPKTLVRKSKPNLEKPKKDHGQLIKSLVRKVLLMRTKKNDFFETKEASMFQLGEVVFDHQGNKGTVRYIGRIAQLHPGYWLGLELDEPVGRNDGSIEGHCYFKCESKKGLFVRPSKCKKNVPLAVLNPEIAELQKQKAERRKENQQHPITPETEDDKPADTTKLEGEKVASKGMVEKLREEVRKNSPRGELTKATNTPPNQEDATKRSSKAKPKSKFAIQRQKQISKDAEMLAALSGKTPLAQQKLISSREETPGQKLGGTITAKPRPDRAARAAFFEKKFASTTN